MIGRIITCEETAWQLPPLLEWDILRTGSVPCAAFSVTCVCTSPTRPPAFRPGRGSGGC